MATFTDGYGGDVNTAQDNNLNASSFPTYNYGAHQSFLLLGSNENLLLRFDLSSLPSGSTINSATLYLYYDDNQLGGGSDQTCTIYSVSSANGDWVAGTGDIELALEDESCWNAKAADGAGGVKTAWAGSAGCATETTDYESTAMATFTAYAADPQGTEYAISLSTSRVAGWCGASNTNYGIILFCANWVGHHFAKATRAETNWRPKLVVDYTAGGNPWYAYAQQ